MDHPNSVLRALDTIVTDKEQHLEAALLLYSTKPRRVTAMGIFRGLYLDRDGISENEIDLRLIGYSPERERYPRPGITVRSSNLHRDEVLECPPEGCCVSIEILDVTQRQPHSGVKQEDSTAPRSEARKNAGASLPSTSEARYFARRGEHDPESSPFDCI